MAYYPQQPLHLGNLACLNCFDEFRSKVTVVCLGRRRWLRVGQRLDHALDLLYGSCILNPQALEVLLGQLVFDKVIRTIQFTKQNHIPVY